MTETGHRKLAAIMFTDIVGYTAYMASDEPQALKFLDQSRKVLQPLISSHGGQWLKEMGDGTLSSFESATEAVTCALDIQRQVAESDTFRLRIGIHVGDVIFEGGDVFGDGVNVAARIEPLAQAGGITVSDQVYDSIRNKPGIGAVFLGKKQLKNVTRPVKVFALTGEGLPPPAHGSKPVRERMGASDRLLRPAALVLAAATIGVLGYVYVPPLFLVDDSITSVAVLPFDNFTGEPGQEYFVEGMHEAIIANLAQIKGLRVISRTSVMRYGGTRKMLPQIARELNADALVEGSVTKQADSVRITAQLIHGRTDKHVWSNEFYGDLRHVLALQSGVAK
ncbi:MAG: adenylate/guanylate cyclase domain-containing protein, partial [Candidatus Neomarinimicrobiota bacterium]